MAYHYIQREAQNVDISELKESLGDEKYAELETYVSDLVGQRDAARNESISGRKGLKEKVAAYETQLSEVFERLGVSSFDELDDLPEQKGAAEAAKQFEAKMKRMERQIQEATDARTAAETKLRDVVRKATVSEAMGSHEFVAKDVVSDYVANRLVWEEDELLFRQDDGKLISVTDGVSAFAKSRPELLKSTGAGGAGVRSNNARGSEGQVTMTRAEFEALPPQKQMEAAKAGVTLQ